MTPSISDPRYTASFIQDWLKHGERGERFILRTAEEQYGNLKHLLWTHKRTRRVPTWCDLGEYCQSVRMLRRAAREIRRGQ